MGQDEVEALRNVANRLKRSGGRTFFPAPQFDGQPLNAEQRTRLEGYVSNRKIGSLIYYIADMLQE